MQLTILAVVDKENVNATGGKMIIQEEHQARIPFVDCTNSIGLPDKNEDKSWNFG